MRVQLARLTSSSFRQTWTSPFHFSVLLTATLLPKLLHLYTHFSSLPCLLILLYMPTFLALDFVNVATFWALIHCPARGRTAMLLTVCKLFFGFMVLGASSVQIAFYLETGAEIKWSAASNFAHDPAGYKLLFSGGLQAMFVSTIILVIARVLSGTLDTIVGGLVLQLARAFQIPYSNLATQEVHASGGESDLEDSTYFDSELSEDVVDLSSTDSEKLEAASLFARNHQVETSSLKLRRVLFLMPIIIVSILFAVRPRSFPYGHMSNSLPYTLLDILTPHPQDMCYSISSRSLPPFPLPDLVVPALWEQPDREFPGWMPSVNASVVSTDPRDLSLPSWLPLERVDGFDRWYDQAATESLDHHPRHHRHHRHHGKHHYEDVNYDPVRDPMRISNLDKDILQPITDVLKQNKINVKHVVILSLESTRKDVFPLKKGSRLHELITKSHKSQESMEEVDALLAKLTVNAEGLTGEVSGFGSKLRHKASAAGTWRGLRKGKGGLNVVGAFTGSTSTFKSMLGSHCGVQPLPVDFTEEAGGNIYQPCLPSIFKLFNRNKEPQSDDRHRSRASLEDFRSRPWKSVFIQSITDQFDRQDELNDLMGFSSVVVKNTLLDHESKHYPPTETESNYFGFPETQAKPYLRDIFQSAKDKNERLFLSHFTSSTHHPWSTPKAAGDTVDYLSRSKWHAEHSLNKYLNTVKYDDGWIGDIMDMLEEFSIADETLVVMVGDHGYAFEEDSKVHATFENGHISNMRVPLLFFHPLLPRIQLAINATSLSILPTILDLLTTTSSLNTEDTRIASNLIHQYEGQSLIRPFLKTKQGRQQWNIGVLNAGGALLSVSSAAVPFRLVLPICKSGAYRFTDTNQDPNELSPIERNSISALLGVVRHDIGDEAAAWVEEAEKIGKWWVLEQRRRWRYEGASLQDDRKPEELRESGKVKGMHWWET